ncbi:MAG: hypothetical protein ABIP48_25565 [Planctomycetota bacterium]
MSRVSLFLSSLAVLAFALGLTGCPSGGDSDQAAPSAAPPAAASHDQEGHDHAEGDHEGHDQGEAASGGSEVETALAELSEEDRALAVAQKTCPVTDQPLGSMGKPVKVTVKDREVFLCCEGCKGAITKDPDKYLAKLAQ